MSVNSQLGSTGAVVRRRSWRLRGLVVVVVLVTVGVFGLRPLVARWRSPQPLVPLAGGPGSRSAADAGAADPDAAYRKLAIGAWHDEYKGKRTMTLKADGTGLMVVELSGFEATLVGSRLEFDLQWSIDKGVLREHTTGGRPATQVGLITKAFGDHADQPILELTARRLLVLDPDGKTRYDWKKRD